MGSFQDFRLSGSKQPRDWVLLLLFLLISTAFRDALGQQASTVAESRIERYRFAIDQAKRQNLTNGQVGRLWAQVASDEEDIGQFDQAEGAYLRALELFQHDPALQADYGVTLSNLGTLYAMIQRGEESLNCHKQSLSIFLRLGDPLQIARAEEHLVAAYLILGRNKEAEKHAILADREFLSLPNASGEDKASTLVGYTFASCLVGHCAEGLNAARRAMELVRTDFAAESFAMGQVHVALGFAEWRTGSGAEAERDLREGIRVLRLNLPPSHPFVLQALDIYRRYLSDAHRETEAQQIAQEEKSVPATGVPCGSCTVSVYGLRSK